MGMIQQKKTVYIAIVSAGIILVLLTFRNQKVPYVPPDHNVVKSNNNPSSQRSEQGNIGKILIDFPGGWARETPSSSMRIAQFRIPNENGSEGELAVFSKIGGSIEQNLSRWAEQFKQPDNSDSKEKALTDTQIISGMPVTFMYLTGTFLSGGMMGSPLIEKPNYALHAAIVEIPDDVYYFKMTGPESTVMKWKKIFREKMLQLKYAG